MNCLICRRLLDNPTDPLSTDCGGDCWGCVGEIEAKMGYEPSLVKEGARMDQIVKTIYSIDGERGVEIFRHPDGLFSFAEIKQYEIPTVGRQWRRDLAGGGMRRGSFYDSADIAEREARAAVRWLIVEGT